MLKVTIHRSRAADFPAYRSLWKQNNSPPSSSDLSLVNFFTPKSFTTKIVSSSKTLETLWLLYY